MINKVVNVLTNRYLVAAVVLLFLVIPVAKRVMGR